MGERGTDLDLMQRFDGEIPDDGAAFSDHERAKLEGLEQVGDVVREQAAVALRDAEPQLGQMWAAIERNIHANGAAPAADEAAAELPSWAQRERTAEPASGGLLEGFSGWLERWRSHLLTGSVAAAAAAVLIVVLRPPQTIIQTQRVEVPVEPTGGATTTFATAKPEPAVVEDLEVSEGSGTILTIPGEDGENPTTVIWVTPEPVEGPI